jgi:type I restriction-modification system DNA methylase subunit
MTTILSKEERTQVVNSHKKNLAMNQYNFIISKVEEDAKVSPDASQIASLNAQITAIDNQLAALDAELASIAAESDPA